MRLAIRQSTANERETARGRHRRAWTTDEAERLAKGYRSGTAVAALALAHGRTTAAIEHRLVEMRLMRPVECLYGGAPRDRRAPSRVDRDESVVGPTGGDV